MTTTPEIVTLLYDAIMIAIGSYGAFTIFYSLSELDHNFSLREILLVFRKRWYAVLALVVAVILFFYQIFVGLNL